MEVDNEVSGNGNSYTTEFRQYDPRLGRWKSLDPLMAKYPEASPFSSFNNNPILFVDPTGLEGQDWVKGGTNSKGKKVADNQWHWRDDVKSLKEAKAIGGSDYSDGKSHNTYHTNSSGADGKTPGKVTLGTCSSCVGVTYDDPVLEEKHQMVSEMKMREITNIDTSPKGEIIHAGLGEIMLGNSAEDFIELRDAWGSSEGWQQFADIIYSIALQATLFAGGEAIMAAQGVNLHSNVVRVGAASDDVAKGSNVVYHSVKGGTTQYVGITNNLARRAAEHLGSKGINIEPLMSGLSRSDARAVEQALIEIHGLMKNGGNLINRINSIAKSNPIYGESVKRGMELLKSIAY